VVFSMLSLFGTDIEAHTWKRFRADLERMGPKSAQRDRLVRVERIIMDARDRMNKAFMRSKGVVPPQPVMMALARWLAKRLRSAEKAHKKAGGRTPFTQSGSSPRTMCGYGKPPPSEGKPSGQPMGRVWGPARDERKNAWFDPETYRDPDNIRLNGFPMPYKGDVMPGRMTVEEPARPHDCETIKDHKKRTWSAAEEGTQIGDVYRIITDQRVFKRKLKRKRGGGTVLFDISGSMDELADCINEVIAANPAATTCATYCGDGSRGTLKVIVRDGSKVEPVEMEPEHGGNVVDLPAVDWLSRMPEPRVWVTDQGCTGQNDEGSPELLRMCLKLCDAHNISIVESPWKVAEFLKDWSEGMTNTRPKSRWLEEDE
jgi:hypothetical protein